jgi:hypothetical protein
MKPKITLVIALAGAAFLLGATAALAQGGERRDAGDATRAKLALQSPMVVVRDAGDAARARFDLERPAGFIRDAGDAAAAKQTLLSSPIVVRDAGDSTSARLASSSKPARGRLELAIEPAQLGLGFGIVLLVLTIVVAVRLARSQRLAH